MMHGQLLLPLASLLLQLQLLTLPIHLEARHTVAKRWGLTQRVLQQGSAAPAAVTDPSGTFGAAPADSADCSAVCKNALGMSEITGGVQGQQACAVYSEAAWLPDIRSTGDFKQHARFGRFPVTWRRVVPTHNAGLPLLIYAGSFTETDSVEREAVRLQWGLARIRFNFNIGLLQE
jgi:hypothetical protein